MFLSFSGPLFHPLWVPSRSPCAISSRARRVLMDWVMEVCHDLAPGVDSIIHLAAHAIDSFLVRCEVSRKEFQLVRAPVPTDTVVVCSPCELLSSCAAPVTVSPLPLQLGAAAIVRAFRIADVHVENLPERMSRYTVRCVLMRVVWRATKRLPAAVAHLSHRHPHSPHVKFVISSGSCLMFWVPCGAITRRSHPSPPTRALPPYIAIAPMIQL